MRRILVVALALSACHSAPAPAPVPPPAAASPVTAPSSPELAAELTKIRRELDLPGLAAAAWQDGALVEQAAVGTRVETDPDDRVTTSDRWHLGSNTKAMTATLIGIFVDRGTLHWTDTIGGVLGPTGIDPGYQNVTIDQLLHHEGGAPAEPPPLLWRQLYADALRPDARMTFVRGILATPPAQPVGTFAYSNAGYMIAAALLEARTGKRWEELIQRELFDTLGMTSCGFGPPAGDQPRGHDRERHPVELGPAADNPPGLGPAGTVHCALADYGRFLNLHATGQPALVSAATLAHLHVSTTGTYAGGWIVADGVLAHSGSNTMWYAIALVIPARRFALAIVTNVGESGLENHVVSLLRRYVK